METEEATVRRFQKELNAGTISLVLLSVMERATEPNYGYQIVRRLDDATGGGELLKQGTVYPLLRSMEKRGLLESEVEPSVSGPPRRYYTITDQGSETLRLWQSAWERTRTFVDRAMAGADEVATEVATGGGDSE